MQSINAETQTQANVQILTNWSSFLIGDFV